MIIVIPTTFTITINALGENLKKVVREGFQKNVFLGLCPNPTHPYGLGRSGKLTGLPKFHKYINMTLIFFH